MRRMPTTELKQDVAERLGLLRRVLGITQTEFAKRVGMARSAYNMIENGERALHVEDALRLRAAYGVTLDWIYVGDRAGLRHELASAMEALQVVSKLHARRMADERASI